MILPISEKFRITTDKYQWIIQKSRFRNNNGQRRIEWIPDSYHPTSEAAISAIGGRMVRDSKAVGFIEALAEINIIVTNLRHALPSYIEVHSKPPHSTSDKK